MEILSRWLHVAAAGAVLGSFLYARFVVAPGLAELPDAQRAAFSRGLAARLRPIALSAAAVIVVSGAYNFYNVLGQQLEGPYHAVFGVKVLLALHVLGMLFLVSAPPQDDPGAEAKRSRLLTGAAVSALLIFALAAYLKFLHA